MDNGPEESRYLPAALKALELFPVEAEKIELVAQSENVTFRVSVRGSNVDYVLRLHRPDYNSIEELNSERMWTRALGDAGEVVPVSLETCDGEHYALVDIPGAGEQRYAGMTTWYEGTPLCDFLDTCSDKEARKRVLHRLGEIAAAFHNRSSRWQAPPGFVRRRLDVDALLGENPFWGRFWDHPDLTQSEQELLLRARTVVRAALTGYGETPDNFSLIHADFTPENIIFDGGDLAVIDFDDLAYGWHMYDIASALVECRFDDDFEALQAAFLEGYRQCRDLAARDLEVLPDFLLVRGMAIIGWYRQRPEYAGEAETEKFKNWVVGECRRRGL